MANAILSELGGIASSFSGVDIKAIIAGQTLHNFQAISFSVTREKVPIHVCGRVGPLTFGRGKRGIAGTLISVLLDGESSLLMKFRNTGFMANKDEIIPDINPGNVDSSSNVDFESDGKAYQDLSLTDIYSNKTISAPWYVDQILPFPVCLAAGNEFGATSKMILDGVELLNEGSGVSIDDTTTEQQFTYICLAMVPWLPIASTQTARLSQNL